MKKLIIFIITLLCFIDVYAIDIKENKINVQFDKCIDGDTARFKYQNEVIKVRFLAIDTPEVSHGNKKADPYGKEASDYTCEKLKNAQKITIEFDLNSDLKDKYDRYLGWIFVDNKLLQEDLVKNGYAKVAYLYGDYKYTSKLKKAQKEAQKNKLNIWSDSNDNTLLIIYIVVLLIASGILFIVSKRFRKKQIRKAKNKIKKDIKKQIKKY